MNKQNHRWLRRIYSSQPLFYLIKCILIFSLISVGFCCFAQFEVNASYSGTGVTNAKGFGINTAYELPIKNSKFGIKPQLGYKCNCGYLDFTGTDFINRLFEFHTTVSYPLVENKKYQLIPNIGINLRYSYWSAQMRPPLNTLPGRFYVTGIRGEDFSVSSSVGSDYKELKFFNPGYSIQLQNRFKISERFSINATPFIELDYDKNQETGGGYLGISYYK